MQNVNKSLFMSLGSLTGHIKKTKLILGFLAAAGISLALYFILGAPSKASENYLTGTVQRGNITSTISASGTVEPVETISMSFKDAEIVKKIYVKVGDKVEPGQLLAELATDNLEADVMQSRANFDSQSANLALLKNGATQEELAEAEAKVSMAQASYNLAQATLERNQALYQAEALAQSELDQIKADYDNAEASLKQAEASLKSLQKGNRAESIASAAAQVESAGAQLQVAQRSLSDAKLISPINGIVSSINGAEGQRATANNNNTSGDGFMEVISEALQVEAKVNEGDIGKTKVGQQVEFTVNSYPDKTFAGKVSSISPTATTESNVQIYDVMIQLDENYSELKAGMPADVTIIVEQSEDVLTISKGAVTYAESYAAKPMGAPAEKNAPATEESEPGKSAVVLVPGKSGSPEPKQVQLGLSDLTNYEVVSGLSEGETVIVGSTGQAAEPKAASTNTREKSGSSQGMPGGMPGGMPPPGGN
ncbi:HlyD family secretion protein [Desulfotomaculum arcticum]|uniref:HlyD family secretion protein n=1 Tax=Desulfotruncus arcticus DSM 17038 TaxID=1121424 RepID=A0A1I2RKA3_9FIRM|nr:efflux RND transporter periplasmic adaptor subunit [Desulfotruncus arcticus]SFG41085.1 HlyD family secretion protein [Desulfotomaculum arcticum] [Desulfotruncus arcticus DSM 17038]